MEAKFSNKNISELLRNVAAVYLLTNVNRFKIIAYQRAADTIEHLDTELFDIWQDQRSLNIPGIGPTISGHLNEYFEQKSSGHLEKILNQIPKTVFSLMKIPSIGPKKAYKLINELQLFTEKTLISDLKKAASEGRVEKIPSFGKKSEDELIKAIELYEKHSVQTVRMNLGYANSLADQVINYIKLLPVQRIDLLGSLRRRVSTIGDIDIAVATDTVNPKEIIDHFIRYPGTISVNNAGDKKASITIRPNIRVDLRVQDIKSYGSMLQYFTGSKAHNIKLREVAMKKGYSLSEWGVKKINLNNIKTDRIHDVIFRTDELIEFSDEKQLYSFFGLEYIPAEIREGTNELDLAAVHKIPHLVQPQDLRGDLHIHSDYDIQTSHDLGVNSYVQIIEKAQDLGYEYAGFADHNPKQSGLSTEDVVSILKRRKEAIDKISRTNKYRIKYYIGLEVDILPSGEIAFAEKALEYVDYLIVSIHSSFQQSRDVMTRRIVRALSYPKVRIFGHPTGRLINKRPGIDLDWDIIFEAVKKNNQALEINASPERLDLPDSLVREAVQNGIKCIINTDAHAVSQMEGIQYGVSVARRGWAAKNAIINTESFPKFNEWILNS